MLENGCCSRTEQFATKCWGLKEDHPRVSGTGLAAR